MLFKKLTHIWEKFQNKVDLYGISHTLLRVLKAVIHKLFSLTWEKYYLMSCVLDDISQPFREDIEVRELSFLDYDNDLWNSFMTPKKRIIYEKRFQNNQAKAYGAFVNGVLAYSTWILYGEVVCSEKLILLKSADCALLLDTYCHLEFRGKGIHNYMNQWCLYTMKKNGMKKGYVIVLSYNRPAIKTQKKCGLEVEKTFYTFQFKRKVHCSY